MLRISSTDSNNNTVNFKSYLKSTKYVKDALKGSIDENIAREFLHTKLNKLANDGKNSIVEINYAGGKFLQWLQPGAFQITIDGVKNSRNYHFGGGGVVVQCARAIESITEGVKNKNTEGKLTKIRKKLHDVKALYFTYDGKDMDAQKVDKYLKKKYEFYKNLYHKTIKNTLSGKGIWGKAE